MTISVRQTLLAVLASLGLCGSAAAQAEYEPADAAIQEAGEEIAAEVAAAGAGAGVAGESSEAIAHDIDAAPANSAADERIASDALNDAHPGGAVGPDAAAVREASQHEIAPADAYQRGEEVPIYAPPPASDPPRSPRPKEADVGPADAPMHEEVMYDGVPYPEDAEGVPDCGFAELISSGDWLRCGRWYMQAELTLLHRSAGQRTELSVIPFIFQTTIFEHPAMATDTDGFGYEPGTRLTLGKYLGRDEDNRDRSIEFSYLGLNDWTSQHEVEAFSITNPNFLLFTPLDRSVGAFNAATRHEFVYESDYNSFELNARTAWRLGRDRLELQPNGQWARKCSPGFTPSFLGGFRTILVNENASFISERRNVTEQRGLGLPTVIPNADGRYDVITNNRLFGLQVGAELVDQRCDWSFGVRTKIGGYYNFADMERHVRTNDTSDLGFVNQTRDEAASDEQLTLGIEVGLVGTYQLRPNVSLRVAYDFMYLQGLAMATEQMSFNAAALPDVHTTGFHFYDGMTAGIEWIW